MKRLSKEQLISIHSILIEQTGGSDRIRDEELITLGLGLADGSIDDEDLLNWNRSQLRYRF